MDTSHLYGLLGELHDHLVDEARLVGGVSRRRRRRDLIARLRAMLAAGDVGIASSSLVETARRDWASDDSRVRVDDMAPCRFDGTGVWVGAWVLAAPGVGAYQMIDHGRLAAAIVGLPPLAREVFALHCRDGLDYPSIAAKLAISEETVRRGLAAALVALDQALAVVPDGDVSPIA